jgi:hypothetical protein
VREQKTLRFRRRFKDDLSSSSINRQNPQGRPLLISWAAGFHRVSKLGLPIVNDFASFFFTLSSAFWHFRMIKTTSFNDLQLKNKLTESHPGLTGWTGSRVDRVSPGQFPSGFLPSPGPVPGPGRPGPGSTCRAGPGLKKLVITSVFKRIF